MGRPKTPFLTAVWAAMLLALLAAGLALAQSPPQRVALVIANSAYQYSSQLNNPRSDANNPALHRTWNRIS